MRKTIGVMAAFAGALGILAASYAYWKLGVTEGNGAISIDGVAVYGIDKMRGWIFVSATAACSAFFLWIAYRILRRRSPTGPAA